MTAINSTSTSPRVLSVGVVEDDPTIRLFLQKLIEKRDGQLSFAGSWSSAEEAVQPMMNAQPDVVLVDLELPGASGIELISEISPHLLNSAFVVLTIHDGPEKVFDALRAGACGYLLKSAEPEEIADGIHQASMGGSPLSNDIAHLIIKSFREPVEEPQKKEMPGLTRREGQILELLAEGMVPKEVGYELNISYETVRDYLKSVYKKLHVRSRTEAVIKYLQHTGG